MNKLQAIAAAAILISIASGAGTILALQRIQTLQAQNGSQGNAASETVSYNGYTLAVPKGWRADLAEHGIHFFSQGKEVAALHCPAGDFGAELWDFKSSSRTITRDAYQYQVALMLGTPAKESPDAGPLNILTVGQSKPTASSEVQNATYCVMTSNQPNTDEAFKEMYNSLELQGHQQ